MSKSEQQFISIAIGLGYSVGYVTYDEVTSNWVFHAGIPAVLLPNTPASDDDGYEYITVAYRGEGEARTFHGASNPNMPPVSGTFPWFLGSRPYTLDEVLDQVS